MFENARRDTDIQRSSIELLAGIDSRENHINKLLHTNFLQEEAYGLAGNKAKDTSRAIELAQATNDDGEKNSQKRLKDPIESLSSKNFEIRQQAEQQLLDDGLLSLPVLGKVVNDTDAEVRRTARNIIEILAIENFEKATSIKDVISDRQREAKQMSLLTDLVKFTELNETKSNTKLAQKFVDIVSTYKPQDDSQERLLPRLKEFIEYDEYLKQHLATVDVLKIDWQQIPNKNVLFSILQSCPNLKNLDIKNGKFMQEELELICNLPKLEHLSIASSNIERLPDKLSDNLKYLDVSECSNIKSILQLPSNLEQLSIRECINLKQLPDKLPDSLIQLDARHCIELKQLPEVGNSFKILYLNDCSKLEKLSKSLGNLKNLDLSGCVMLQELPELTNNVELLCLSHCVNLKQLPELPNNLKALIISGNKNIERIPNLPDTLKVLHLSGCENLKDIPELPINLRALNLSGCINLKQLPKLPEVNELNLSGVTCLEKFSDKLSKNLTLLNLDNCINLEQLPELPSKLKTLNLSNCIKLTSLPELPFNLEHLYLNNCVGLTNLPGKLHRLYTLDLTGCANLNLSVDQKKFLKDMIRYVNLP